MTAVSLSISRGQQGVAISDWTVGTSAPGTGDFEFRYNITDTNSVAITMLDLQQCLRALERALVESALALPAVSNNSTPFITEPQI